MKALRQRTAVFLSLLCSLAMVRAGSFPATGGPQTYTLPDGTFFLTDSSTLTSVVNGIASTSLVGVQSNALKLSTFTPPAATTTTAAKLVLPVIDGSSNVVSAFTANFDLALSAPTADSTLIGEGFSFNFGAIPNNNGTGETGFNGMSFGLTIGWDTRDNGGEERAIVVYANATRIGYFPASSLPAFPVDNTANGAAVFRPVSIRWDASGLDLTWNGVVIMDNLQTPGFGPSTGDRFAFSTRTTTAGEDVSIDNLAVTTTAVPPLATNGPVIWEFLARNSDNIEDDDFDHPDWIEIYNGQAATQSLNGWFLTNDPLNLQKWAFPTTASMAANAYTYVFASGKNRNNAAHFHTSFTLAGEGGWIGLVRPNGTIAHQVTYGQQYNDVSSGFKSIVDNVNYLSAPTPGKPNTVIPNTTITVTRGTDVVTEKPVFTTAAGAPLASGFIGSNQSVTIQPPALPGAVVRYTTNGTNPTEASTLYTAPIAVTTRSLMIRARVYATGRVPGPFATLALVYRNADLTNYRGTGKPFESNMPVLMLDSFGVSVDSATDPNGARPYRYTYGMLFDPAQGTTPGKASLADVPAISNAAATHVRGQSSSGFPQRPYALEWWNDDDTDKDLPMLGLAADSDWVLYSPFNEETLMRNAVVYNTMNQWAGQGAGMRTRFVEVFFNQDTNTMSYADYRGIYLLVEKIKQNPDRVDVEKLNEEVTNPALITGGYVWKKDKPPQAQIVDTTSTGAWGAQSWEVIDPNIYNIPQRNWLDAWLQAFDSTLMNNTWLDPVNGYRKYADVGSFADNLLWTEAFKNIDGYRISTYFYKTRAGKIQARPAWDYNLAGGNGNYLGGDHVTGWYYAHIGGGDLPYWPRLLQDPGYVREQWDRYWGARRSALSTASFSSMIDGFSAQIRNNDPRNVLTNSRPAAAPAGGAQDFDTPASRHFSKNQTLGVYDWPNCNGWNLRTSFQSEVAFFKEWLRQRLEWMDFQSTDGNTAQLKLRPPNFHDRLTKAETYRGQVAPGFQLDMADPNGLASSVIYYTVDGPDPRATPGAVDPAALTLPGATSALTTYINNGQPWKYAASLTAYPAAQAGTTWNFPAFDDTAWATGTAPVGYGDTGMGTTLTTSKPTGGGNQVTCFRRTFTVADPAAVYQLIAEINADDGAVIYLNGQQAARCNMPYEPVAINFTARATGALDGVGDSEAENLFIPYRLDPALLVPGVNTIAVEVHQFLYGSAGNPNGGSIDDMRFDLRLKGVAVTWPTTPVTLTGTGIHTVRARTLSGTAWSPVSVGEYTLGSEPASKANLVISEIMYNPSPPTAAEILAGANSANDFEYIEIMNIGNIAVDLSGLAIVDAITLDFNSIPAQSRLLAPGARGLLVENRTVFLSRYPGREAQILAVWSGGNLKNSGEALTLTSNGGLTEVQALVWEAVSPWPPLAGLNHNPGEADYSLVLERPTTGPNHRLTTSWRSSVARGNPGGTDATACPPDSTTDSDQDGLSDFLEWAMGPNARPVLSTRPYTPPGGAAAPYLFFAVPRNGAADGVNCVIQSSSNLQSWDATLFTDMGLEVSGGTETRLYRSTQPSSTLGRIYVRAKLSRSLRGN